MARSVSIGKLKPRACITVKYLSTFGKDGGLISSRHEPNILNTNHYYIVNDTYSW